MYYKGTVTHVRQQMPSGGVNLAMGADYDPWEALEVEWDVGGDAEGMDRLSPWEIEVSQHSSCRFCFCCLSGRLASRALTLISCFCVSVCRILSSHHPSVWCVPNTCMKVHALLLHHVTCQSNTRLCAPGGHVVLDPCCSLWPSCPKLTMATALLARI